MIWFTSVVLSLSNLGISDFLTCSEEKLVCETGDDNKDVAIREEERRRNFVIALEIQWNSV